jgi:hypothetical protein
MNAITRILDREPAVVIGALQALLALAIGFGMDLSGTQVTLILTAFAAVFALLTRQSVWAPASVSSVPVEIRPSYQVEPSNVEIVPPLLGYPPGG